MENLKPIKWETLSDESFMAYLGCGCRAFIKKIPRSQDSPYDEYYEVTIDGKYRSHSVLEESLKEASASASRIWEEWVSGLFLKGEEEI